MGMLVSIDIEKAEEYASHHRDKSAFELRVRFNGVVYATCKLSKEQAVQDVARDIFVMTGFDVAELLQKHIPWRWIS